MYSSTFKIQPSSLWYRDSKKHNQIVKSNLNNFKTLIQMFNWHNKKKPKRLLKDELKRQIKKNKQNFSFQITKECSNCNTEKLKIALIGLP